MFELPEEPFIDLWLPIECENFADFYEEAKPLLFRKFIEAFNQLSISDAKTLTIHIASVNLVHDVDFVLSKKEREILVETIIPYFEMIEDYEMCSEIMEIYKSLN